MEVQIGHKVPYLYKQSGKAFTVEATVISLHKNEIQIEFMNPVGGFVHRRTLKSAQDRARLLTYEVPRPGAREGNQNAKKEGPHRLTATLSFSDARLAKCIDWLHAHGKPVEPRTLKNLAYEAIDAYLK